jgi:hypothetical protein
MLSPETEEEGWRLEKPLGTGTVPGRPGEGEEAPASKENRTFQHLLRKFLKRILELEAAAFPEECADTVVDKFIQSLLCSSFCGASCVGVCLV